ncbi:60S ribosomal protein-like protein L34 [Xylogone sp. PMI_703]|nr:60S ribosomal protein-like protein L34 [Xylogone sp. PMI_703]
MLCLRCSRSLGAKPMASAVPRIYQTATTFKTISRRTFTSFTPLRPTIFPNITFRQSPIAGVSPNPSETPAAAPILDLLPKISSHPALGSTQVRCGPRNTFNPSHFVRKRRHGFLSRLRTRKGRMTLQRRRAKRRSTLSH